MSGVCERTASGRVRRTGAVVGTALLLMSCASTVRPGDDAPAPPAAVTLDAFARINDLAALPRSRVIVGAGAEPLTVDVLIAGTPAARARGLQGVADVPTGVGMLFIFGDATGPGGRPGFWMLDTLVPLDIAFAADGVVVGLATMTPCAAQPCPVTHPGVPYDVALEVAAGALADAGIAVGDPFVREDLVREDADGG